MKHKINLIDLSQNELKSIKGTADATCGCTCTCNCDDPEFWTITPSAYGVYGIRSGKTGSVLPPILTK